MAKSHYYFPTIVLKSMGRVCILLPPKERSLYPQKKSGLRGPDIEANMKNNRKDLFFYWGGFFSLSFSRAFRISASRQA